MIQIDLERGIVTNTTQEDIKEYPIGSPEAFSIISKVWLRAGWDAKYVYSFTWLGRPIIQLPDDMIRIQEIVFTVKPDVIIETGVAHGGSLIFYASLCKAMSKGRVVGIDIEIRPHNRKSIEEHFLSPYIELIEGSSTDSEVVKRVGRSLQPDERVMVCLDSCHTRDHVLNELRAYAPLVTLGSYIVAMDGIMRQLGNAPRSEADWSWNNPVSAAETFVSENHDFEIVEPEFLFNEGHITDRVTYWPKAFVRRIR